MSLIARAALLTTSRSTPTLASQRRLASAATDHHDDHHHHEEHDSTEYPKEKFGSTFWGSAAILTAAAVGFYKYAPEPNPDVYLTRWIALYTSPRDLWLEINAMHTARQQEASDTTLLLTDAKKSLVHRYRYPQSLEQISPFLRPVGLQVDTSGVVVKGDKD